MIAHGCNCFCTMGSGIAPKIKAAFQPAWAADLKTTKGDRAKLGTYSHAVCNGVVVANLYTQYGYNRRNQGLRDLDYNALYDALVLFRRLVETYSGAQGRTLKVGLPKLGAGLAGGDWRVIEAMINSVLEPLDVTIYVLEKKEIPAHAWYNQEVWLHPSEWTLEDL